MNEASIVQDSSSDAEITAKPKSFNFVVRWSAIAMMSAIISLSGWALSSPIGSSPDDDYHLPSIWCGQGFRDGLCEEGSEPGSVQVPKTTMANSICFAFQSDNSGICEYSNSLVNLEDHHNLKNKLYPPVFYWAMSWFASEDISAATISIRIANSIFIVLTITTLIILLPKHLRRIPTLSLLISCIPLGIFLIPSTNPSGWAFVSLVISFSALLGFLAVSDGPRRFSLAALFVFGLLLGAGSRPDAAAYLIIVLGIVSWISYSREKLNLANVLFIVTSFVALVVIHFSARQSQSILSGGFQLQSNDSQTPQPNFFTNLAQLPELWVGVFGKWGLGWLDTPMPAVVWMITLCIFTAVIFASVRWFDFRQSLATLITLSALVFIPMYILTVSGLSVGQQIQPRYLLPLIALLGAVALYRSSNNTGLRLSFGQVVLIGAGLFISNTLALHLNTRRYVTGMDEHGLNLDQSIEWWWADSPISPGTVWISASLSFALLLLSLWKLREVLGLPGDAKN